MLQHTALERTSSRTQSRDRRSDRGHPCHGAELAGTLARGTVQHPCASGQNAVAPAPSYTGVSSWLFAIGPMSVRARGEAVGRT